MANQWQILRFLVVSLPIDKLRNHPSFSRPTNEPFTSSYSAVGSQPDNNVACLLAFEAKHPLLTATDADAIRLFLQSWTNYKSTGLFSLLDCIGADALTVLELVYADQLYCGSLKFSSYTDLEQFRRSIVPTTTLEDVPPYFDVIVLHVDCVCQHIQCPSNFRIQCIL